MYTASEGLKLAGMIATKLGEAMQTESEEGKKLSVAEITAIVVAAVSMAAADYGDEDDELTF